MAKGLVQKATRRQALSYKRYAPNPIGVTSLAAINGRGAAARANKRAKGRVAPVVVVTGKGIQTKTLRGASAQAYLRRHHKKHYEKSDFGRLRLAFTTRSGERVSISPKATSRRTSDLAAREARLAKKERALEKKVARKSSRRRTVEYVSGARIYKSRAAYERAETARLKRERAARKRRGGKPTAAQLRRAGKTLERGAKAKAKKRGRKTVSRRKLHRHDLSKLPMRSYYASTSGGRIKGSPVIGIREEDVVVVPARRNGKRLPANTIRTSKSRHGQVVTVHGPRGTEPITLRGKKATTYRYWMKTYGFRKSQAYKWAGIVGASEKRGRLQGRWMSRLGKIKKGSAKYSAERARYATAMKRFDSGGEERGKGRLTAGDRKTGESMRTKKRRSVSRRKTSSSRKPSRSRAGAPLIALVRLDYTGRDAAKARALRKIAKRYGGKDLGSSFSSKDNESEHDFGFKSKRDADKAEAAMDRIRGVNASSRVRARRLAAHMARKNGHGESMRSNKRRGKLSGAALAAHERRIASGKRPAKRTKKGHRRAPHAGKGLLSVKIGGKIFRTYMVKGKGGKVVHVPRYKLLGFKSERALQKVLQGSDEKKAERISKKLQAIYKKRAAAAARVQKHGDVFTPNARRKHRYEDWSENTMKANKRRGKGKSRKSGRGHTKSSRRAAAKKAAETKRLKRARRSKAAKKAWRTRKGHHAKRSAAARKGHRKGRKSAAKRSGRKGGSSKRSRAGKLAWKRKSAAEKKRILAALARGRSKRGGHRKGKGKGRKYTKNRSTALANRGYTSNRSSHALANRRRHHRRNGKFTMNGFGESVKVALESGAIATAGFIAHRGIGWLLSEKLFSTFGVFADASTSPTGVAGSMAPYRRIVAGAIVGAGGIVLAEKAMPKQATMLAAGIVVSFLQQIIVTALGQVAPAYVPAVSGYGGYGDRSGKAFKVFPGGIGEYFLTGQNGYGEYFLTGQSGFGASERAARPRRRIAAAGFGQPISQAAAGFGQISQAAAGYGGISQAAAGYGQTPMLSQAAAGVGEYFLTGANGIGEYETVQPSGMSGAATVTDEGIQGGDTNAAERALNIAEGVAGVSDDMGIGVQSIVDPTDVAVPVNDEPQGSRAGILAGGEGIFGGAL